MNLTPLSLKNSIDSLLQIGWSKEKVETQLAKPESFGLVFYRDQITSMVDKRFSVLNQERMEDKKSYEKFLKDVFEISSIPLEHKKAFKQIFGA